jgi:hypothetical protein
MGYLLTSIVNAIKNRLSFKSAFWLFLPAGIAWLAVLSPGCANVQSPVGGKKDTIPPVLIKAVPDENTLNFKGNTIRFAFDEYITLQNLNDNLIINPPQEKYPTILSKLRTLSVKLLDTLQPNTTYTINFGNAVKDVNEGNVFKNFSYTFSTGTYIDSLALAGKLVDAETGIPDSTMIIMLHTTEADSAVAKKKPSFVTRPNGRGVFRFDHLPDKNFYIFALRDEGNRRYTSPQTPFAFLDSVVTAGEPDSIMLRFFVAEKEPEKKKLATTTSSKNQKKEDRKFKYGTKLAGENGGQDLLEPLLLTFEQKVAVFDTSKIVLTDTLYHPLTSTLSLDSTSTVLSLTQKWKPGGHYRLVLQKGFAKDSTGLTNTKPDTVRFTAKAESDYGSLRLKLTGLDFSKNPLLQFVDNSGTNIVFAVRLTSGEYFNNLFKPGQYKLRILYDTNKNGKWDTGNYWKKMQPELVLKVDQGIDIKNNWDNEIEIRL